MGFRDCMMGGALVILGIVNIGVSLITLFFSLVLPVSPFVLSHLFQSDSIFWYCLIGDS